MMERPIQQMPPTEFDFPGADDPTETEVEIKPQVQELPTRRKRIGPKPGRETPGGWRR